MVLGSRTSASASARMIFPSVSARRPLPPPGPPTSGVNFIEPNRSPMVLAMECLLIALWTDPLAAREAYHGLLGVRAVHGAPELRRLLHADPVPVLNLARSERREVLQRPMHESADRRQQGDEEGALYDDRIHMCMNV